MGLQSLTASSQKVVVPNAASLQIAGDITVSFWVNFKSVINGGIVGKSGAVNISWTIISLASGSLIATQIYNGGFSGQVYSAVAIDTLYHVVMTLNSAVTTVYLYFNNSLVDSNNAVTLGSTTDDISFGFRQSDGIYSDMNSLYDIRVYNRHMPVNEIATLYHARGSDNIVDGLVGRWLMNEKNNGDTATVANSIIDISGNGNDGSPTNSPIYKPQASRLISRSV